MDKQEKIARISDILEQIDRLNEMVAFHKDQSKEGSMMRQYQEMQQTFMDELEELLGVFKVKVDRKGMAA